MRFLSDNAATACAEVLDAVIAANAVTDGSYDGDRITQGLDAVFGEFFGRDCRVFAVGTGTAANALGLAAICPSHGAVVCHEEAHIHVDECGAPEFFTGGAKLLLAGGDAGKITPATLERAMASMRGDVHQVVPSALSLTQATEYGTAYAPAEVAALADIAHARGWRVHMDGARFANALLHLGCHPGDVTWRAGVDVLSFGFIKNGGMSAEALVFFDVEAAAKVPYLKKRAGQMPSKGRFAAAQLVAMIESGVWQRNARAANDGALRLAAAAPARVIHPVEANELFVRLTAAEKARLRAAGADFYDWGAADDDLARLVVAWDTPADAIGRFAAALAGL